MTRLEKTSAVLAALSVLCMRMAATSTHWFDVVWGASVGLGFLVAAVIAQISEAK